jgi:hypothetical protein
MIHAIGADLRFGNGNVLMVDGNKLTIQVRRGGKSGWWILLSRKCETYRYQSNVS